MPHRKNCKVELFRETHRLRARIKAGKKCGGDTTHLFHLLASDLVSHKAGYGHPQDDEGDLAVFLVAARCIEVGKLGPGAYRVEGIPGDAIVRVHGFRDVVVCLNCMVLVAELFVDPVKAFNPPPRPGSLGGLQLLDG